jgi:hypothetical protein
LLVDDATKKVDAAYCEVFRTEAGLRVLADIESFCGLFDVCWRPDPHETSLALGARSVALYLRDRIAAAQQEPKEEPTHATEQNAQAQHLADP